MPQQQRQFGLRLRQLDELDIHLLDLELAVRVNLDRRRAGREHDFLRRKSVQRFGVSADMEAADLLDQIVGCG